LVKHLLSIKTLKIVEFHVSTHLYWLYRDKYMYISIITTGSLAALLMPRNLQ